MAAARKAPASKPVAKKAAPRAGTAKPYEDLNGNTLPPIDARIRKPPAKKLASSLPAASQRPKKK